MDGDPYAALEMGRREFVLAGVATMTGGTYQITDPERVNANGFEGAALLIGPTSARPSPNSEFFDDKVFNGYIYEDEDTGERSIIRPPYDSWTPLNYIQRVPVFSADDLPGPTNGTHTLDGQTAYVFNGFVTSTAGLDISNSPVLMGRHGSMDGFIHTGGATAITGTDGGFFARDAYFSAPGGTMFDISGDQATEMLVESCAFSDAAGLGNIASLGTISGYRVPTFKGCNFEDFDGGLSFDGSPDKIFIAQSPARTVTASGVTIFTVLDTCDVDIMDIAGNYVKDVQSDTEVWRIEAGGEPNLAWQYRGNTHDATVTKSNILTGPNIDKDEEPVYVEQSYPLADSVVIGEMHFDEGANGTVTINSADTWVDVDVPSIQDTAKRMQKSYDGHQEYTGTKDTAAQADIEVSFYGQNGDIYRFGIQKNAGDPEPQHSVTVEARGQNANVALPVSAVLQLETNDIVHFKVKNESAANDATIVDYSFTVRGG